MQPKNDYQEQSAPSTDPSAIGESTGPSSAEVADSNGDEPSGLAKGPSQTANKVPAQCFPDSKRRPAKQSTSHGDGPSSQHWSGH